ncbi:MAG: dolichol kinase [candidate division Zixibacteria bacterium]|nr:dolichol kinase [candidate division Zixibacteria bacterium]
MTSKTTFLNELKRKAVHFFALSIPIGYYFIPKSISLLILIPITSISITLDIIRLRKLPGVNTLYLILGPILRRRERFNFAGSTYILFGSVMSILFFNKRIAIAAISFIILGDIASALVGKIFGRTKLGRKKTLEGSIAFLLVCFLVASIIHFVSGFPLWIGLIGAVVATLVENLTVLVDDNVTVPLLSGLVMQLLI